MPTLKDIGDSEAVDNSYIDKIIFYVEGDDDQNLFSKFFFRDRAEIVEVKQPPGLEGGFNAVISRVRKERPKNPKIFGILDGEALLAIGEFQLYKKACNGAEWIWLESEDGIVLFPCWEIENFLFNRQIALSQLQAWLWKDKKGRWNERKILRHLLLEVCRLTEIAAFNCALHQTGGSPIRAQTKTQLASRRDVLDDLHAQIPRFPGSKNFKQTFDAWRQFFGSCVVQERNRETWYDELMNRIDGKALLVRIRRRMSVPDNFLGTLAEAFVSHPGTYQLIGALIEQAARKAAKV